jgi:hypothetical protein
MNPPPVILLHSYGVRIAFHRHVCADRGLSAGLAPEGMPDTLIGNQVPLKRMPAAPLLVESIRLYRKP